MKKNKVPKFIIMKDAAEEIACIENVGTNMAILIMYWLASGGAGEYIATDIGERLLLEGQFITSIKKLAENWGWSEDRVCTFLDTLASDFVGYIEVEEFAGDDTPLIITMLKYDEFVVTA